ncbi:MAG: hypothetical protein SXA11_17845 [Cyanobacteriota bacterium]|nr:hypothetical protein [Cyanobacteriota bacterium]
MTQANNLEEQAQRGNPQAIAALLSDILLNKNEDIIVEASINNAVLEIILEAEEVPDRYEMVEIIRQELTELEPDSVERVKIAAHKTDALDCVWTQAFGLEVGAFSSLILPGAQEAMKVEVPSVKEEEEEIETDPENDALDSEQLSKITLGIVTAILAVAVIVFIGKMIMERSPSEDNENPTAYALIIPN